MPIRLLLSLGFTLSILAFARNRRTGAANSSREG